MSGSNSKARLCRGILTQALDSAGRLSEADDSIIRASGVTLTGPNARTITNPQPSLFIFTKKYFSLMGVTGDKPRPDLPQQNATDAQKAATWGPFNANAGIYEVKGTTFTFRAIVGKNPNGMAPGSFQTGEIKVEGNTLTLTWKATNTGPITNPVTVKLTRLE